jgi:hypothetical protein
VALASQTARQGSGPPAELCFLVLRPAAAGGPVVSADPREPLKDAPGFEVLDVEVRSLETWAGELAGVPVRLRRQVYDDRVQVWECRFGLLDVLDPAARERRAAVEAAVRERLGIGSGADTEQVEEYAVLLVGDVGEDPDAWLDRHGALLARLVRVHDQPFGRGDVSDILVSRVHYSERHLTVVDWEGAVVIAPDGDFQSDVELLKIGSYQVLRYRLLDELIEGHLEALSEHLAAGMRPSFWPSPSRRVLREVTAQRLALMLDFERIDQSLLLIGDWYTAQLYRAIYDEFYLDAWKASTKEKLDSLASASQVIQEHFAFSWRRVWDTSELVGWMVLLLGYLLLFYLDWKGS